MSIVVRAIDVGFGNTKYVMASAQGQVDCAHFASLAYFGQDEIPVESMGGRRRTVQVPVDGLLYEVGPDVEFAADRFRSRQLHDGYTQTAEYRALATGALHFMKVETVDLLVVGLPVSQYTSKRAALQKAMTGTFHAGRKQRIVVRGPPAAQAAPRHHRDGSWHGLSAGDAALKHGSGRHWTRSLRFRLLAATLAALAVALVLAGLLLSSLFRDHVMRQFSQSLTAQLDQITARLEFDAAGQPQIDPLALSDPRWSRPYSGLYWQVDGAGLVQQRGVLRSRSLWDAALSLPKDGLADGVVHVHEGTGPDGAALLLVERTVKRERGGDAGGDGAVGTPWRLTVAADLRETVAAVERFNGVLAASLATLFVLLCASALAQIAIGLAPLRALQRTLAGVRAGTSPKLDGRFPSEVQPLVDDFNAVLERNAEVVARARTQAGNLAHAIKTPLAAMSQAAAMALQRPETGSELAALVEEQVGVARRHVDWHLARARAAAAQGVPGARVRLQPIIHGLLRVLERVHAERGIALRCLPMAPDLAFAGEVQDLQEVLGNLLDNACKWARQEVQVSAASLGSGPGSRLQVVIDDDGPGIEPDRRESVMARGTRLDESVPGSGLGLAIVNELVGLYGGSVRLQAAPTGGLRVEVELPGA